MRFKAHAVKITSHTLTFVYAFSNVIFLFEESKLECSRKDVSEN